jgi:DNA-directed RNA polymerase subunit RPC12/RpoP
MLACPHCGQRAMTLWRKCTLGPEASVACAACGKPVGVPWGAIAAAVPVALGIVAAAKLAMPWGVVGLVAGGLAYVGLQRFVVPLVSRGA